MFYIGEVCLIQWLMFPLINVEKRRKSIILDLDLVKYATSGGCKEWWLVKFVSSSLYYCPIFLFIGIFALGQEENISKTFMEWYFHPSCEENVTYLKIYCEKVFLTWASLFHSTNHDKLMYYIILISSYFWALWY